MITEPQRGRPQKLLLCVQMVATKTSKSYATLQDTNKKLIMAKIGISNVSQKQLLQRLQEDIPSTG